MFNSSIDSTFLWFYFRPFYRLSIPCTITNASLAYEIFCLTQFFTSQSKQFSYVGTGLSGLNHYKVRINVSCSRTQDNDAGETRSRNPSVSCQALFQWATALPILWNITDTSQLVDEDIWLCMIVICQTMTVLLSLGGAENCFCSAPVKPGMWP